ncbi:unnamed protein product [Oreochromis niloticus]|nr:unnamed protein product [Mustela putorius furo]
MITVVQKTITAESGQDVALTCRAPNNNNDIVEWSRADLGDKYVFVLKNKTPNPDDQHQSFLNRVDLQDREMKDGNVSIILKNMTSADNGTYECRVFMEKTQSWEHISIITLSVVDPPGQTGGHTEDGGKEDEEKEAGGQKSGSVDELIIGLSVFALVVFAAVVGFLIYRKYKQRSQDSYRPTTEPQIEMSERFLNSESPADEQRDRNDLEANNCHEHSTRIPDVTLTLEDELLHPPQETAGLHPETESTGLLMSSI